MRVAFIGNMNNNFFSLVRYLRERGHDARLLSLNDEYEHFLPDKDTFENGFEEYVSRLDWGDVASFYRTSKSRIRRDLESYEFLSICGSVPAFLRRIERQAELFLPYGGDLCLLPFPRPVRRFRDRLRNGFHAVFRRYQRGGIRDARVISTETFIPLTARWLEKLGVADRNYYLGFPMVYDREFAPEAIAGCYARSRWYPRFKAIRDQNELVVFHHCRHLWKNLRNVDELKNNQRLIAAFARLVKDRPRLRACLVLFEYGEDVESSKRLIRDLDVEDRVRWFPILPRKEIMVGLSLADLGAGEFAYGFFGGGVMWEILLSGKPLLGFRDDAPLGGAEAYPMLQARTEDEIHRRLQEYLEDRPRFDAIGAAGRAWTRSFFDRSIDAIVELIEARRAGGGLDALDAVVRRWREERGRRSILEWPRGGGARSTQARKNP
jgi:hypothetical protein